MLKSDRKRISDPNFLISILKSGTQIPNTNSLLPEVA